ncbi:hypothetical protein N7539_007074 [Penicillium diatomitis]|uniref:Very-long-chain (3R)-3-hydroxyacyl-CoA dehydratase n=1 Tax=Penicillium diatomitis TaxID=2819901 RepID=A0A9W9X2R1_9EURO|nr:uncharacterized protein N7539_007074 [Penicillium diatomitis]KAJ5481180.1 hypothetical protein N7539_007074 [Penicillium diatomitis]
MSASDKSQARKLSSVSQTYLLAYNVLCAIVWLRVLTGVISELISSGRSTDVYASLEPWTRYAQTLAAAEVLHAIFGITRSPVFTTFTQAFARSTQVWAVNYAFPRTTSVSYAYPAMILAWSMADVVRYSYFAVMLAGKTNSGVLRWLRYSLFVVLYPVGISSEWWLMYKSTTVTDCNALIALYYFFLALYGPGSVMMYKYMLKQRKKVLARAN